VWRLDITPYWSATQVDNDNSEHWWQIFSHFESRRKVQVQSKVQDVLHLKTTRYSDLCLGADATGAAGKVLFFPGTILPCLQISPRIKCSWLSIHNNLHRWRVLQSMSNNFSTCFVHKNSKNCFLLIMFSQLKIHLNAFATMALFRGAHNALDSPVSPAAPRFCNTWFFGVFLSVNGTSTLHLDMLSTCCPSTNNIKVGAYGTVYRLQQLCLQCSRQDSSAECSC